MPRVFRRVRRLLEKYAPFPLTDGQTLDIANVNLAFKQIEQKRKAIKLQIEELEKRKRAFDTNESRKLTVRERGEILRKSCEEAKEKIAFVKDLGTLKEAQQNIIALK